MRLSINTISTILMCIFIVSCANPERQITVKYKLVRGSPGGLMIWSNIEHVIVPDVLCYGLDSLYLLAIQKPLRDEEPMLPRFEYKLGRDVAYYWAISLKSDSTYGPMTETEFLEFKMSKNISEKIIMERARLN